MGLICGQRPTTRERSRMSLMTLSSESAEVLIISASSCCSASSGVSNSSWLTPMMPFSGVRISLYRRKLNLKANVERGASYCRFSRSNQARLFRGRLWINLHCPTSCDMLARNWDLASFAAFALSRSASVSIAFLAAFTSL